MWWLRILVYFVGGVFFVNAIPHFTNGVSGRRFPTPFSYPIGSGRSPAVVNVLWGSLNLVVAYVLLRLGRFQFCRIREVLIAGVGALLTAVILSRAFASINKEKNE